MKTFTTDILRQSAPIAAILLVGLLCGSAAFAGPISVSTCAAFADGPTTSGASVFPVSCNNDTTGTLEATMSSPFTYTCLLYTSRCV